MPKKLYETHFLSLYETDLGFIYAQRRNVNSTAGLIYKKEKDQFFFYLRYQPLPMIKITQQEQQSWKKLYPCCVTGSLENHETPKTNIIKEVYEEMNLIIDENDIKKNNCCVSTTQMNEVVYNFVIDATNAKVVDKEQGDGSIFEKISENKWVSEQELIAILNNNEQLFLSTLSACYILFLSIKNQL